MKNKYIGELVLNQKQIQEGVQSVAEKLNAVFQDAVVITVVPGGILFTADLVRELNFNICMEYISCPHTPAERSNNSEIVFHQNININDKDVIVIDDAIESGGTMKRLIEYLSQNYQTKSLSVATLLVKPGRVKIPVSQYYAYEMTNDDLLVGYGLPWEDNFRNLPYISKLVK